MDWDYYGDVIPRTMFSGQETPDDVAAAAFAVGYPCPGGYTSGILIGAYRLGAGSFIINNCRVLENLGMHPAADRLLLNMIRHAGSLVAATPEPLEPDFETRLAEMGYV